MRPGLDAVPRSRRWDKAAAHWAIDAGLLRVAEAIDRRRRNVLRVLAYHRIGEPGREGTATDPSLFSASTEAFGQQMHYLSEHYQVLSLDELLDASAADRELPPRSVLITFDDAYRDFRVEAWPILKELGLPVVLFVATGYAEGTRRDFWWDVLYRHVIDPSTRAVRLFDGTSLSTENDVQRRAAFERAKLTVERHGLAAVESISLTAMPEQAEVSERTVMDWNELRTLESEGVFIAPHTRNHPVLSWLPLAEAAEEVELSRFDIEQQLSRSWPIFAYPHGHPRHIPAGLDSILRDSGFRYAVTMIEGHNIHGRTPSLHLKRLNMAPHLSLQEFRLALTGVYDLYALAKRMAP